jgi:LysR family glycine cleavage system transcriptional activator
MTPPHAPADPAPGRHPAGRLDVQMLPDLWIFTVVAQESGMAAAGRRLGITQAAVSQRMARLEARLQQPLFERRREGLALTAAGHRLFAPALAAMTGLEDALGQFDRTTSQVLVINCTPSLAADWLIPQCADWYAANPHISLDIRADQADLSRDRMTSERIDVAIRYAPDPVSQMHELAAFAEITVPVCAPTYRPDANPDLVLLGDDTPWLNAVRRAEWRQWQAAAAVDWPGEGTPERRFNLASLAYDCAALGQGVALGRVVLIGDRVQSGRLVAAHAARAPGASYRFFSHRPAPAHSHQALFVAWATGRMALTQAETLAALEGEPPADPTQAV